MLFCITSSLPLVDKLVPYVPCGAARYASYLPDTVELITDTSFSQVAVQFKDANGNALDDATLEVPSKQTASLSGAHV